MKKIIFIVFSMLVCFSVSAQSVYPLKGPQAKNFRGSKAMKNLVVTRTVPLELKGPDAKHHLRQGIRSGEAHTRVTTSSRMWLKGPGAKNYQPRIQKFNPNVFRKRSTAD